MSAPGVPAGPAAPGWLAPERRERVLWWIVGFTVALLVASATLRVQANPLLTAVAFGLVVVAFRRFLLAWHTLLAAILLVILLIPIRRYSIGGGLPITIEPYRVVTGTVLACWLAAALVDPAVRLRKLGIELPIACFAGAIVASVALNIGTITGTGILPEVIKGVSFMASFLLVMYFVASTIATRAQLDRVIKLIVGVSALIAVTALVEWRTGFNPFNRLESVLPVLRFDHTGVAPPDRGGHARAYASAQHPIALGAMLVTMLPLAIYLYRRERSNVWLFAAGALVFGTLATGSRTAIVMLVIELLMFLWLKRGETMRLMPLLLPLMVAVQFVMPGTLGTFRAIFFPKHGLIAEQSQPAGSGSGRVADLGPSLEEWMKRPFLGQGYSSRLTSFNDRKINAAILDDQWLGLLLEVGAIGFIALAWVYVRTVRRLARWAKHDPSPDGWLTAALATSIAAWAIGMLTFDAFAFIQATFLSFTLLGIAGVALRLLGPYDRDRWARSISIRSRSPRTIARPR